MTPFPEDELAPVEEGRRNFLALVTAGSFSVEEVAYNVKQPQATISSGIGDRRLFAIWNEGSWRIPKFQFLQEGQEVIPGIAEVNMRLPLRVHPVGIERWFRLGDADIDGVEQFLSPLEWLKSCQDLQPSFQIAKMLQYQCFQ